MVKEKRIKSKSLPGLRTEPEFAQQLVDLARVTRVVKGGKRLSFRACIVIGNHKGEVGTGIAKGMDVSIAVEKAVRKANKNLIKIPIINDTIPHWVKAKYGAAKVLLRPASKGHGIVAGGAARTVLLLTGIKNITAKILGSKNKINNVQATLKALEMLKLKE
ncbi:MAG: 30S ribosomal protein S5 [Patescibacteria group bacterium]|jgi:small subunit ribosomal protein S5|nr:30S ribosomal protein S5 [Patescibacteria group bacterium]MDD5172928.1 30S ribosomal protein S5 [Patescibacteria group bacterium]